jgi:4-hydroxybenzoate polyprenyltransferase
VSRRVGTGAAQFPVVWKQLSTTAAMFLEGLLFTSILLHSSFWVPAVCGPTQLTFGSSVGTAAACVGVYVYDRLVPSPEDAINQTGLHTRFRASGAAKLVFFGTLFAAAAWMHPTLLVRAAGFVPFAWLYSTCALAPFRVKTCFLASKNLFVAAMWTLWFLGASTDRDVHLTTLYARHMFLSNVMMDMKDIRGDAAAGIPTIPAIFGEKLGRVTLVVGFFALALEAWWWCTTATVSASLTVTYGLMAVLLARADVCDGIVAAYHVVVLLVCPAIVATATSALL